jgi:hypothetical protein
MNSEHSERIAKALESIAESLARITNPPMLMIRGKPATMTEILDEVVRQESLDEPSEFDEV